MDKYTREEGQGPGGGDTRRGRDGLCRAWRGQAERFLPAEDWKEP